MGQRNIIRTPSTARPLDNVATFMREMRSELGKLKSIVSRDCIKLRGYELEYHATGTGGPGVYLVNKRDGDPNFGTMTFLGQ